MSISTEASIAVRGWRRSHTDGVDEDSGRRAVEASELATDFPMLRWRLCDAKSARSASQKAMLKARAARLSACKIPLAEKEDGPSGGTLEARSSAARACFARSNLLSFQRIE